MLSRTWLATLVLGSSLASFALLACSSSSSDTSSGAGGNDDGGGGSEASTGADSGGGGATDGAHEGGQATSEAGVGQYMGPCDDAGAACQAPADQCYDFPTKGSYCTKACDASSQCPAPSPKCTPRGVCAVPD